MTARISPYGAERKTPREAFITLGLVAVRWLVWVILKQYIRRGQITVDNVPRVQPGYQRAQPASDEI